MGFEEPDIDIEEIASTQENGYYVNELCEGCGVIGIGKDEHGVIIIIEEDGSNAPWDPEEDRELKCRLKNNYNEQEIN